MRRGGKDKCTGGGARRDFRTPASRGCAGRRRRGAHDLGGETVVDVQALVALDPHVYAVGLAELRGEASSGRRSYTSRRGCVMFVIPSEATRARPLG